MITVNNVTKKYGKFKAVDNISFEINDGEIIGLLGPNGAGKSTTMNILTGFIEPTEGNVIINGYDISKKPKKAKKCIGYMPEGVPLYKDMTVKEFIGHIEKTIKTLDNHVLDARDEMYNEALKLLADEEGFKELEQARLAYQKALEVHYLMGTIQDQKQLANSKVNLLDVLRKDNDGTTNR